MWPMCLLFFLFFFFNFAVLFSCYSIKNWIKRLVFLLSYTLFSSSGPENKFAQEFLGFSVYVSNTTKRTDGILCFKDTNFTAHTIPPVINITCIEHAQFVIYYNERQEEHTDRGQSKFAFNDICELEVYGDFYFFFNLQFYV